MLHGAFDAAPEDGRPPTCGTGRGSGHGVLVECQQGDLKAAAFYSH